MDLATIAKEAMDLELRKLEIFNKGPETTC